MVNTDNSFKVHQIGQLFLLEEPTTSAEYKEVIKRILKAQLNNKSCETVSRCERKWGLMTKHYSNKPDFPAIQPPLVKSSSYFKSNEWYHDDISGGVVRDEGVGRSLCSKWGSFIRTTKDSTTFDKSLQRIFSMVSKTKKIHSDIIMQNR